MRNIQFLLVALFTGFGSIADAQLLQRQPVRGLLSRISGQNVSASCSGTQVSCSGGSYQASSSCSGGSYLVVPTVESYSVVLSTPVVAKAATPQYRCDGNTCVKIETASVLGSGYFKDRIQFKRGLLQACQRAEDKGDQPQGTTYLLGRRLRLHPGELTEIMEDVRENAEAKGITAIDWNALLDMLERLIPIILKLINLFSMDVDTACYVAMALTPVQVEFWLDA